MATFDWVLGQGKAGDFDNKSNWFNETTGKLGAAVPGAADEINLAGNEILGSPNNTVAAIHLFQFLNGLDIVRIIGTITVTDEITFQNASTGLRVSGTLNLINATTTLDLLQVGGPPLTLPQKSLTVDDDGAFNLLNGSVTAQRLAILNNASFTVAMGGVVNVSAQMTVSQTTPSPFITFAGADTRLLVDDHDPLQTDLLLDGRMRFAHGATGKVGAVTISSTDNTASLLVGQYDGVPGIAEFRTTDMALGDGQGGTGYVIAATNGRIIVTHAITMADTVVDTQTFSGELTTEGGSIEIGQLADGDPGSAAPDTIQINPAGFTLSLQGHGYINTPTLVNNGGLAADGGLLLIGGKLVGNGVAAIGDNATLQLGGSVDATSTILFAGPAGTLTLDRPQDFAGRIINLQAGDKIVLNHTGSALGNAIQGANILGSDGGQGGGDQFLALLRAGGEPNLLFRIEGQDDLIGNRFEITESADGRSTTLELTTHGTTTSYYLDAAGTIRAAFIWGDRNGGNTDVFVNPDGTVAPGSNGLGDPFVIFDYTNHRLNSVEYHHIADGGGHAYTKVFYDNAFLQDLDPRLTVQLPSSPDRNAVHDLWYTFRHGAPSSFATDDGLGTPTSYFAGIWEDGALVFDTLRDIFSEASAALAAMPAATISAPAPAASNGVTWQLTASAWNKGILTSFNTEEYFQGQVEVRSTWVLNDDGSYTRTSTHAGGHVDIDVYSLSKMLTQVIPLIGASALPNDPPIQRNAAGHNVPNIPALLLGPKGTRAEDLTGQPTPGNLQVQGQRLISQDGGGLISQDGGGLIGQDGGGLTAQAVSELISQDGGGLVASGGGNLVASGGGNLVAQGGGNLVGNAGGTIAPEGGAKVVGAGSANMFTLSGTGSPGSYLANALVFQDSNGDGQLNHGEAWTVSDANGHFQLFGGWGTLVMTGGTDTGTHLPFTGTLTSPLGSTDISALTTLVEGLSKKTGTIDGALKQVQNALGLDPTLDFTIIDPIASTMNGDAASAEVYVEMSKAMDTVILVGSAFAGLGADRSAAQQAAFAAMVDMIAKNGTLDLSDKSAGEQLVASVAGALKVDASTITGFLSATIASSSQLLEARLAAKGSGAALVDDIVAIETAVQGKLASTIEASKGDPDKLGPMPILFTAVSDNGKSIVTTGHVVTFTLTLSDTVTVTGAPTLQLDDGAVATFAGGSGTSTLLFTYMVKAGDSTPGLQVTGLDLSGGATVMGSTGKGIPAPLTGSFGLAVGNTVTIAAADANKAEGHSGTTALTFTVTLAQAAESSQTVNWSVSGAGAAAAVAADFAGGALPAGTLTFAAGESSKTIVVAVAGDSIIEADEGFAVTLAAPSAELVLGTAAAAGTIMNDDAAVSISALSATQAEGTGGTTAYTFTLTARGDLSVARSIAYAVTGSGATAANADDFTGGVLPSGIVTLGPGETSRTITVEVAGDATIEPSEGFTVALSNPSAGLAIELGLAAGAIINDDGATVSIAAAAASKAEGNGGATEFTFTVTLSAASVVPESVAFAVAGSGANAASDADFTGGVLPAGTVTFAPRETSRTITLGVAGDSAVEADEGFTVTLSSPSVDLVLGAASAAGTIVNDDALVSLAALAAIKAEGSGGSTDFTVTVSRTGDLSGTHSVAYAVTGAGANPAEGSDFAGGALPGGTVSFAAGQASKTITVTVAGDGTIEPDEGFAVTLSNPSGGLIIGTASASGTIVNDDAVVSIASQPLVQAEGHAGTTAFTFTVTLAGDSSVSRSVSYAVTGAGANPAAATDFAGGVLPAGTVSFAAGETSRTITVLVAGDTAVELAESFAVTLSNPSVGLTIGTASATGTIGNDDATISLAALAAAKAEGNGGTTAFTFTATRTGDTSVAHSVAYGVSGATGNPANAADFAGGTLPNGTVSFAPGESAKTVTVLVSGDATVESDEGFVVSLSAPSSGLTIAMASASGTILNDDKAAAVVTHDDAYIVLQGQSLAIGAASGLLANDLNASTASLASNAGHGSLQLAGTGGFTYAPAAGFAGIDQFTYHSSNSGSSADGHGLIYVVPISGGASPTLNLLALTAQEQIAATYVAFFGRAADRGGFGFWVGEFQANLPTQGAAALFANVASSFGVSAEAQGLYPFLANPFGASDSQISAFLDSVYLNLFNRSSDSGGLAYWTSQTKQTLAAGQFVGSILVNIMSGAQDTAAGKDISTLMGKVAVSLDFVHQQELHGTNWAGASDTAAATNLLRGVTSDPLSVLTGIKNADILIEMHG